MNFEPLFYDLEFDELDSTTTSGSTSPYHSVAKKKVGRKPLCAEVLAARKKLRNQKDRERYRNRKNEQTEEIIKLREETFNLSGKLLETIQFLTECANSNTPLEPRTFDEFLDKKGFSQYMHGA
jgi:hypothetical protein